MVVEVDEAAIAPHLECLADVARRHGVQGPTELDVVIGMDRAACPRQAINWGMLLRNKIFAVPRRCLPVFGLPGLSGKLTVAFGLITIRP